METRASYVAVGSFVIGLTACLLVAMLWFARVEFGDKGDFYDIYFTGSVSGLNIGSAARQNGVPIGRVVDIKLDPDNPQQVRVTIQVQGVSGIKSDAVASLELQGLTGGEQIEITGGSRDAPMLEVKDDERYPVVASSPSGLQQVVTSAPELLARANGLMEQLSQVLSDDNRKSFSQTLTNLQQVTGAAANHSNDIGAALSDGAAAAHDLRATMADAHGVVSDLQRITAPGGTLDQAVHSFEQSGRQLSEVGTHLDALVQENRAPLRDFTQRGLAGLQELTASAHTLVSDLDQLVEALQRDPSRLLYGDRRQGYQPR